MERPNVVADENVNLFFGNRKELNDVVKRDDATTAYIIMQNDSMHSQIEKLKRSVERVSKERDNAVDDFERNERSKVCIRGMLHNELEKSKMLEEMVDVYESVVNTRASRNWRNAAGACVMVFTGAVSSFVTVSHGYCFAGVSAAVLGGIASLSMWLDAGPPIPDVSSLKEGLQKAQKGNEHLHNIVDEL